MIFRAVNKMFNVGSSAFFVAIRDSRENSFPLKVANRVINHV